MDLRKQGAGDIPREVLDEKEGVKAVISKRLDLAAVYEVGRRDGMVSLRELAVKKMLEGCDRLRRGDRGYRFICRSRRGGGAFYGMPAV